MIVKELIKKWKVYFTNKNGEKCTYSLVGQSLEEVQKEFVFMADRLDYAGSDARFYVDRMEIVQYGWEDK